MLRRALVTTLWGLVWSCSPGPDEPAAKDAVAGGGTVVAGVGGIGAQSGGATAAGGAASGAGASSPAGAGGIAGNGGGGASNNDEAAGAAAGQETGGASGADAGGGGGSGGGGSSGGGSGGGGSGGGGSGGGAGGSGGAAPLVATTLFLAGDSTVSTYADTASDKDQAGWGQMLREYLKTLATVDNRAVGGRTSRRFIEEGYLDQILSKLRAGDYLFVQFGTNDGNKTATYTFQGQTVPYYLDPETDFKTYVQKYIDGARAHQASPVLVTPPPRNSAYCTGGNGTGAYAEAMRELGQQERVPVVDLNKRSVDYLKAICPAPTPEDFFLLRTDGTVDGTHFQENGARILAGFVAAEIRDQALPLAGYLK